MTKQIEVGKTYKLVDASKDPMLLDVIETGFIKFPDDGLVTVSSLGISATGVPVGYSFTKGLTSPHPIWLLEGKGIIAISQESLDLGCFEEVTDAS